MEWKNQVEENGKKKKNLSKYTFTSGYIGYSLEFTCNFILSIFYFWKHTFDDFNIRSFKTLTQVLFIWMTFTFNKVTFQNNTFTQV